MAITETVSMNVDESNRDPDNPNELPDEEEYEGI